MQSLFWFIIWLLFFGGISSSVAPLTRGELSVTATTPVDSAFTLNAGDDIEVADDELILTFSNVVEDSRCPANVSCVWSGMVVVELEAAVNGQPAQALQLGGMTDNRGIVKGPVPAPQVTDVATIGSFEIQLLSVTPYPAKAEALPDMAEYQVRLNVRNHTTDD